MQDESEKKLEQITEIRAKMKEVSSESRNKDELYKQLVSLIFMIQLDFQQQKKIQEILIQRPFYYSILSLSKLFQHVNSFVSIDLYKYLESLH